MNRDVQRLKDAAAGRWVELLVEVAGIPREHLDGQHHPCFRCGGDDRFRLVDEDAGAVLCNQCFHEKNGDGLSAVMWARGCSFPDALALLADRLGVKLERTGRGRGKGRPDARLEFLPWNDDIARLWARTKPGITAEAVRANGGKLAHWTGGPANARFHVVALPIHGAAGEEPRGWAMYNSTGAKLPTKSGQEEKILCTRFSKAGWLGLHALEHLETARVVWKVEGPSDMLALWSVIPAPARDRHLVVSTAFGASEKPRPDLLEIFRGKQVVVVADPDDVGRKGAERWARAIARDADAVRLVELDQEGGDLRDRIAAGWTYAELRELVKQVPNVEKPENPTDGEGIDWEEEDADPSRLGREFVRQRAGRFRWWRNDPFYWTGERWVAQGLEDFEADIVAFLRDEFRRVCAEKRAAGAGEDGPPKCYKITSGLVRSVRMCARSYATVSQAIDWGKELELDPDDELARVVGAQGREWVAFRNGILDLGALLSEGRADLQDHSPLWWSPNVLPYEYDQEATLPEDGHWQRFLEKNLRGDPEKITTIQEWLGYCLVPWTSLHTFLILEGEGANGKSVFCALLEALVGPDNCSHVPLELFGQRFALTPTLGKLANIATECGELDKVAEGFLKAFVAGEEMNFDRKNKDPVNAEPTARLTLATNNRPRFSDRTDGLWRRMQIVELDTTIAPSERIVGMDKPGWWISGPGAGELPAIFNWALDGLARLRSQDGFTDTAARQRAVEEYKIETNPAREFLLDQYEATDDAGYVAVERVYAEYKEWCKVHGYRSLGNRTFGKEVRRVFPRAYRHQVGSRRERTWVYRGVAEKVPEPDFDERSSESTWST